jgi:hypothetical protein
MSHDPKTPGEHGIKAAVIKRGAHKLGRPVAQRLMQHPRAQEIIRQYPEEAKLVAEGLAAATEWLEIPGAGMLVSFLNRTVEVVSSEVAEIIGENLKGTDDPEVAAKLDKAIDKAIEDELDRKVKFIGNGTHYVPVSCAHHERAKGFEDVPRHEAIRQGSRPGCAWCYNGSFGEAKASKSPPPPPKSLLKLLTQLAQDGDEKAQPFVDAFFNRMDDAQRRKYSAAFAKGLDLEDLKFIASRPEGEWSSILDTLLGIPAETPGPTKFTEAVRRFLDRMSDKIGKRLHSEGEEASRFLDGWKKAADGVYPEFASDVTDADDEGVVTEHVPDHLRPRQRNDFAKYATIIIGLGTVIAWVAYAIH